eukprot:3402013-Rhodomonas_salina.1
MANMEDQLIASREHINFDEEYNVLLHLSEEEEPDSGGAQDSEPGQQTVTKFEQEEYRDSG